MCLFISLLMLQGLMPWGKMGKGRGGRSMAKGTGADKETDEVIADPLPYVSTDEDAYMSH